MLKESITLASTLQSPVHPVWTLVLLAVPTGPESLWESFSGSLSFSLCHQKNSVRLLGGFTASHAKWSMNKSHLLMTGADKCPCS